MSCAIVALLSLYLSFLYFGLLVRTRSGTCGLCHRPCPLAHIKWFGSSLSACLCLLISMLACVSLSCSRLCHVWHPQRVCSCMVTSDAYEALSGCNHLGSIATMSVALCIPFPFSAPCDDMLTMLVCATRWLYMHLCTLAYISMHESCLLVCRPCFNTMKLWTFDLNLHFSLGDTTFCSLSCLFAFLLVWLLSCLFVFSLVCLLSCFFVCHVYHVYLFYASFIYSLHLFLPLLVYWFLIFAFACTHMKRGRVELGHDLPGASKKGYEHVDISQTARFSRYRSLAFPFCLCTLSNPFLPPPFLS